MKRRYRQGWPQNPPDTEPLILTPKDYVHKANTVSITKCQEAAKAVLELSVKQQQKLEHLVRELGIEEIPLSA